MNLNIGIVAHTKRSDEAKTLLHDVRANFISMDDGTLGCDDNHETVLNHLSHLPSTWSLVLEDDAQPINNLRYHLDFVLPLSPSPIVSLYLGTQRPPQHQPNIRKAITEADDEGAHWIVATRLFHAVGYAIRTDLLPSLLSHHSDLPIDQHITNWARLCGHTIAYTWPSLVDHADTETLVDHPDRQPRRPGRKAHRVGNNNHWSITTVTMRS